jgi:hypothetical protein
LGFFLKTSPFVRGKTDPIYQKPKHTQHHPPTMRSKPALIAAALFLTLTIIFLFTPKSHLPIHIPGSYPYVRPSSPIYPPPAPNKPAAAPPPAQLIVKVQLEGEEDLSWLLDLLPTWRNQVITIEKRFTRLSAGGEEGRRVADRGRVVDAYLRWIVENYENLGGMMVFVPPGMGNAKEKELEGYGGEEVAKVVQSLQVPFIQKSGFAALSCPSKEECGEKSVHDETESRALEVWEGIFNNTRVPEALVNPGSGGFVVTREQVRERSVEEYLRYWTWLDKTKMDDETAGLVVEKLWHVVFGKSVEFCPEQKFCKCEVFGKC